MPERLCISHTENLFLCH